MYENSVPDYAILLNNRQLFSEQSARTQNRDFLNEDCLYESFSPVSGYLYTDERTLFQETS